MKIRNLQLKNIGVFNDERIEFQPCHEGKAEIHIFTGENGSGKTTLLMVLASTFDGRANDQNLVFEVKKRATNFLKEHVWEVEFDSGKIFTQKLIDPILSSSNNDKLSNYNRLTSYHTINGSLSFAAFSYSGNRAIKNEDIEFFRPYKENPLKEALDFVKNYDKYSINQWIAHNLSSRAIEKEKKNLDKARKFAKNIENFEEVIEEIIGYKIGFILDTENRNLLVEIHNEELSFDVLPSGLQSLISWIGDLMMRLDNLKWEDDTPIFEREILLFLDEIEVHLHPAWQRKVLPVVQKLFKNSQIFLSTHSPFVVNSVDDAWVYELEVKDGKAKVREKSLTKTTESIQTTLEEVFEISEIFGYEVQKDLDRFYELRNKIVDNGRAVDEEFKEIAKKLLKKSEEQNSVELQNIVAFELKQLKYEL